MKNEKADRRKSFLRRLVLVAVLAAAVVTGVRRFLHQRVLLPEDVRRIILISIDTCRADHLSCYGYPRKTTPNIDAIAAEAVVFRNVVSPVPLTLPGHCSMLTGTIPAYHGVHDNEGYKLDDSHVTLAELLRQNGFTTGAFVSAFVLDSQFGLAQGFDTYGDRFEQELADNVIAQRRGDEVSRFGVDWLYKHKDERFFLFLHYYDPHSRYEPPEPFASEYRDSLYAGEIAYVDYCIGQVIAELKKLGLYESCLLVITGDHGEMLGEHKELTHGYFIYQGALKVPLIVKLPGRHEGRKIDSLVGLVDIVPTICGLLNIDAPAEIHGEDLSGCLRGGKLLSQDREFYCESMYPTRYKGNSLLGLVSEQWKYIQTTRPEMYDLFGDPGEFTNVFEREPHRARIFQDRLRQILESTVAKRKPGSKMQLDEEAIRRLESLGYIAGGSASEEFDFDQTKDDPKDLIGFHLEHGQIANLLLDKKYKEAQAVCEKLLADRPGIARIYIRMGDIAVDMKDQNAAVGYYKKAIELEPDGADAYRGLGTVLMQQGKDNEAVEQYNKSLSIRPNQPVVLDNLARLYHRQGKIEQAANYWLEALKIKPDLPELLNNLAWAKAAYPDQSIYDPNTAVGLATRACELTNYADASMLDTLGVARAASGDFAGAVEACEKAIEKAKAAEQTELATEAQAHLELFRSGKSYSEVPQDKSKTGQ
jgi:arylsulfatase A-like enzyme/Tfp pilus assembly protein PilF